VDLLSYFMPNPNHPVWGGPFRDLVLQWSGRPDGFEEFTAALPLVVLGVCLFAWRRTQWRPVPVLLVVPLVYLLLSLGPFIHVAGYNTHIPGPWAILRYAPVIGLARSPARIAVITLMCVAVLFAVALKHLTERYPQRRRLILATVGALLLVELVPAPRTLYSAEIPAIYDIIAEDPNSRLRVIELPFGVRDGASSLGNFSALSQYYQTMHGKALVGGYISRVSTQRKLTYQKIPMLNALMTLSEGLSLSAEQEQNATATSDHFLVQSRLGYVVVSRAYTSPALLEFATRTLGLRKIAEDGERDLYMPREAHLPDPLLTTTR
jgi:hypothetical protein